MAIIKQKGATDYTIVADGTALAAVNNPANVHAQDNVLEINGVEYQLDTLQLGISSYNYGAALGLGLIEP